MLPELPLKLSVTPDLDQILTTEEEAWCMHMLSLPISNVWVMPLSSPPLHTTSPSPPPLPFDFSLCLEQIY
jgi:hypothetical protein